MLSRYVVMYIWKIISMCCLNECFFLFSAAGYVELPDVFRLGFIVAGVNALIWGVVGTFWWKFLGLYWIWWWSITKKRIPASPMMLILHYINNSGETLAALSFRSLWSKALIVRRIQSFNSLSGNLMFFPISIWMIFLVNVSVYDGTCICRNSIDFWKVRWGKHFFFATNVGNMKLALLI